MPGKRRAFRFCSKFKESLVFALPVFPLLENKLVRLAGELLHMRSKCVHFSRTAVKESAVLRIHSIQHDMQMVMRGILISRMHRPDQLVVVLEIRSNRRRIFYRKFCIIRLFIKGNNNVHNWIGTELMVIATQSNHARIGSLLNKWIQPVTAASNLMIPSIVADIPQVRESGVRVPDDFHNNCHSEYPFLRIFDASSGFTGSSASAASLKSLRSCIIFSAIT